MHQEVRGTLTIDLTDHEPTDESLRERIAGSGCKVVSWGGFYERASGQRQICCEVQWRARDGGSSPPAIVDELRQDNSIDSLRWEPHGVSGDSQPTQTKPAGRPPPQSARVN